MVPRQGVMFWFLNRFFLHLLQNLNLYIVNVSAFIDFCPIFLKRFFNFYFLFFFTNFQGVRKSIYHSKIKYYYVQKNSLLIAGHFSFDFFGFLTFLSMFVEIKKKHLMGRIIFRASGKSLPLLAPGGHLSLRVKYITICRRIVCLYPPIAFI